MPSLKETLTKILIDNKLITPENLARALQAQKEKGGRLSDTLVAMGFIAEKDLMFALSEGLGIPPIDLAKMKVNPEVVKLIPRETAEHYLILPISKVGTSMTMAMADPLNIFAIDDIKTLTGLRINPVISTPQSVLAAIKTYYEAAAVQTGQIEEILKDISEAKLELIKGDGQENDAEAQKYAGLEDAPVVKLANKFLAEGIRMHASDILLEPLEKKMRVRYRVDGLLRVGDEVPKYMHESLISRIKVMAALNIAEHRLPQDGRFKVIAGEREVDFRISVIPTACGEKLALRVLDKLTAMLDIEKLGFSDRALERMKHAAASPHGMILICGPTGSGKTTTLYSLLKYVDSPEDNIVSVEDPVEFQLEGINQVTAHPELGLTFAAALRSILRQDPDVIMVGEIRDFETLDIAIKSALTGHLLLTTLHTTTACGTIVRLVNMGAEPFLINSCVLAIISQRLIRRLCPKCRKPAVITDAMRQSLKLYIPKNSDGMFYQPQGCNDCFNVGYRGRVGICEVLTITPKIRELVMARAQEADLKKVALAEGMETLRADGVSKALQGLTSLEEVFRVTVMD